MAANVAALGAIASWSAASAATRPGKRSATRCSRSPAGRLSRAWSSARTGPPPPRRGSWRRNHQVVRFDRERDDELPDDCAEELIAPGAVAGRRRRAGAGGLQQGRARSRGDPRRRSSCGRERELPVVVDPKFRHIFDVPRRDGVQAERLRAGAPRSGRRCARPTTSGSRRHAPRSAASTCCVTLGEDGMALALRGGASSASPPWRARCTTSPARATP